MLRRARLWEAVASFPACCTPCGEYLVLAPWRAREGAVAIVEVARSTSTPMACRSAACRAKQAGAAPLGEAVPAAAAPSAEEFPGRTVKTVQVGQDRNRQLKLPVSPGRRRRRRCLTAERCRPVRASPANARAVPEAAELVGNTAIDSCCMLLPPLAIVLDGGRADPGGRGRPRRAIRRPGRGTGKGLFVEARPSSNRSVDGDQPQVLGAPAMTDWSSGSRPRASTPAVRLPRRRSLRPGQHPAVEPLVGLDGTMTNRERAVRQTFLADAPMCENPHRRPPGSAPPVPARSSQAGARRSGARPRSGPATTLRPARAAQARPAQRTPGMRSASALGGVFLAGRGEPSARTRGSFEQNEAGVAPARRATDEVCSTSRSQIRRTSGSAALPPRPAPPRA